jgi:hypothetical protein
LVEDFFKQFGFCEMLLGDSFTPTEEWAKESAQIADGHAKCPAEGIDRQHLHGMKKSSGNSHRRLPGSALHGNKSWLLNRNSGVLLSSTWWQTRAEKI